VYQYYSINEKGMSKLANVYVFINGIYMFVS